MKIIQLVLIALLCAGLFPCCKNDPQQSGSAVKVPSTDPVASASLTGAAKAGQYSVEMCNCLQPVITITQKAQALIAAGNKAEADKLKPEMEATKKSTEQCGQALEAKYGKLNPEEGKAAFMALQKDCPEVAKFLRAMMSMQRQTQPVH